LFALNVGEGKSDVCWEIFCALYGRRRAFGG